MSEKHVSNTIGMIKHLDESTRDYMALGIWFVVLVSMLFLNTQSRLVTAGLMFQLTGAYSTFLFCGKPKYGPFIHCVPYAFALAGAVLLCLAPDFRVAVEASLTFLAVIAMMHGSVVYDMRIDATEADGAACVSEYVT